jgi:hypothetical protein
LINGAGSCHGNAGLTKPSTLSMQNHAALFLAETVITAPWKSAQISSALRYEAEVI